MWMITVVLSEGSSVPWVFQKSAWNHYKNFAWCCNLMVPMQQSLQLSFFLFFWNNELGRTEKFLGAVPGDYSVNSCRHHIVVFIFNGSRNGPPCKSVYCTYSLFCADICPFQMLYCLFFDCLSRTRKHMLVLCTLIL